MNEGTNQVIEVVDQLKRTARLDILAGRMLPCRDHAGYLLPICDLHRGDDHLIATLARWRDENATAFPSQFPVTLDGTRRWMEKGILDNEKRILFLVLNRSGWPIGHVGASDFVADRTRMEIENIVRGVKTGDAGLMSAAIRELIQWARNCGVVHFHLKVFSDNAHAVNFYQRLGFRAIELLPLRNHVEGDAVIYRPVEVGDVSPADKLFLHMAVDTAGAPSI